MLYVYVYFVSVFSRDKIDVNPWVVIKHENLLSSRKLRVFPFLFFSYDILSELVCLSRS